MSPSDSPYVRSIVTQHPIRNPKGEGRILPSTPSCMEPVVGTWYVGLNDKLELGAMGKYRGFGIFENCEGETDLAQYQLLLAS